MSRYTDEEKDTQGSVARAGRTCAVRDHLGGEAGVPQSDGIDGPTPVHVVIEFRAASVGPVDAKRRLRGDGRPPKIARGDFTGTVTATGDAVEGSFVGKLVVEPRR